MTRARAVGGCDCRREDDMSAFCFWLIQQGYGCDEGVMN